ncbi:MAG: YggS family pyridoxal phosphate-dependent enzyme [Rikenellaceae bacterium]
MSIIENFQNIHLELPKSVKLCAVSKFHPASCIEELYDIGHRIFGESRPQELAQKAATLPRDIEWHFIGHLQTNKVNIVVEHASLIESVDSERLLSAISKEAVKQNKKVKVLLQLHIAKEEAKQGFTETEIIEILSVPAPEGIEIVGLMAMATYTSDDKQIKNEFLQAKSLYDKYPNLTTLSMGMSGDYPIAIECGANSVRIGSIIFGGRY